MKQHTTLQAAIEAYPPSSYQLRLHIPGLAQVYSADEPDTFELTLDRPPMRLDGAVIEQNLLEQGVSKKMALDEVEALCERIWKATLVELLVERIEPR